jgi:hypothetical protein
MKTFRNILLLALSAVAGLGLAAWVIDATDSSTARKPSRSVAREQKALTPSPNLLRSAEGRGESVPASRRPPIATPAAPQVAKEVVRTSHLPSAAERAAPQIGQVEPASRLIGTALVTAPRQEIAPIDRPIKSIRPEKLRPVASTREESIPPPAVILTEVHRQAAIEARVAPNELPSTSPTAIPMAVLVPVKSQAADRKLDTNPRVDLVVRTADISEQESISIHEEIRPPLPLPERAEPACTASRALEIAPLPAAASTQVRSAPPAARPIQPVPASVRVAKGPEVANWMLDDVARPDVKPPVTRPAIYTAPEQAGLNRDNIQPRQLP